LSACLRIIGAGNLLRADDGLGVHVVRQLEALPWPAEVELLDVGTGGLDVVHLLADATHVCLVDAMQLGGPPGTVYQFAREDVRFRSAAGQVSMHGFGLATALELGEKLGIRPELYLVGVEPECLDFAEGLSPAVQAQVDTVVQIVQHKVAAWLAQLDVPAV
jgi:hydrogenase maturation protease